MDEKNSFCIDVGRTLLMCALVERDLKELAVAWDVVDWLQAKAEVKTVKAAIIKMQKLYGFEEGFVGVLEQFREDRNRFVHEIWGVSERGLGDAEGRGEVLTFVIQLYAVASSLHRALWPGIVERYRRSKMDPPDWRDILAPATA